MSHPSGHRPILPGATLGILRAQQWSGLEGQIRLEVGPIRGVVQGDMTSDGVLRRDVRDGCGPIVDRRNGLLLRLPAGEVQRRAIVFKI